MNIVAVDQQETPLALLREQWLFSQCSQPILASVVQSSAVIHLVDGDSLFQRGDFCDALFILAEGRIKLLLPSNSKQTGKTIAMGQRGHGLNTPALFLEPAHHLCEAQSQGESLVIVIPKAALITIMTTVPTVRLRVMEDISSQLMRVMRFKTDFLPKCAVRRVMEYILELVPESVMPDDAIVVLPRLKQEIAEILLLDAATFSRALKQLQERALIAVRHRQIMIPSLSNFRNQMNEWDQRVAHCA